MAVPPGTLLRAVEPVARLSFQVNSCRAPWWGERGQEGRGKTGGGGSRARIVRFSHNTRQAAAAAVEELLGLCVCVCAHVYHWLRGLGHWLTQATGGRMLPCSLSQRQHLQQLHAKPPCTYVCTHVFTCDVCRLQNALVPTSLPHLTTAMTDTLDLLPHKVSE